MKRISKPAHFYLIAAGLAGISLLVLSAVISPYTAARHLLRSLKPQVQSTVAAGRFARCFALEVKESIDYGLIGGQGSSRKEQVQKNVRELRGWRYEAQSALIDLRSAVQIAREFDATMSQDDLIVIARLESDHSRVGRIEERIRDLADEPNSDSAIREVIEQELTPLVSAIFSNAGEATQKTASDLQSTISRLAGNLDAVLLYSGAQLRYETAGMDVYLSKPLTAKDLFAAIESLQSASVETSIT